MATAEPVESADDLVGAFDGQVLKLDAFRGLVFDAVKVDWKANLCRTVVLAIGLDPKDGSAGPFDLDAAMARLGYFKIGTPTEAIEGLAGALYDLATRCERAREILKKQGNWGMLDTSAARAALARAAHESAATP
jgi:hypothetical protein